MNVLDSLLGRVQPGYEPAVREIVGNLRAGFGPAVLDGASFETLAQTLACALERRPANGHDSPSAMVIRDLQVLDWCCGLPVGEDVNRRLARLLRRDYRLQFEAAGLKRPKPDPAARRSHVVFVGALAAPTHSPSIAAVGYLRALAANYKTRRVSVFHNGPINPELAAMLRDLPPTVDFHQIETTADYLAQAVMLAPCTYHFWCFPRTNIDYSFAAMFGPTVMFTCADDPPVQYADVYWSCQSPEHIARVWAAAPPSFPANFTATSGAGVPLAAPVKRRTKADLGIGEDELLLATVGNRLAIDLDEVFVSGVERVLRARPACRWLVVGALPQGLREAMRAVLGRQFLHVEFDRDLAGLMGAADLWLNPFRRGGGASAVIASRAGVPVLTRSDIGDVASCFPAAHGAPSAEAYFAVLDRLLADRAERERLAAEQRRFLDQWLDEGAYAAELDRLGALAFDRFRERARRSLDVLFPDAPAAAEAA